MRGLSPNAAGFFISTTYSGGYDPMNNEQLLDLVKQMTLEEKTAQLLQLTANFYEGTNVEGQITGPMEEMGITEQSVDASGSILGLSGAQAIIDVQQAYMKKVVWAFRFCSWLT